MTDRNSPPRMARSVTRTCGGVEAAARVFAQGAALVALPLGLAAGSGCARANPAFEETDSASASGNTPTSPTSATSVASGTTETTAGSTTLDASTSQGVAETGILDVGDTLQLEFLDDDAADFAAGSSTALVWASDALQMEDDIGQGEHISRVFSAGATVKWMELRWQPRAPYGVGIPSPEDSSLDTDYPEGGISLDNLELLLRLNVDDDVTSGDVLPDASGHGNNGEHVGPPALRSRGVFGGAYTSESVETHVVLEREALQVATSAFTWALWFRIDGCETSTFLALDDPNNVPATSSAWFMCSRSGVEACGTAGHLLASAPGASSSFCGDTVIDDDVWHHVAYRRSVGEINDYQLFVDGQPDSVSQAFETVRDLTPIGPEVMSFSGQPLPTNGAPIQGGVGTYDEVTMWRRGLSNDEIESLYLRGARAVRLQVRACVEADCADAPAFLGPDGTENTAYLDPGPHADHTVALRGLTGAALQYRMTYTRPRMVPSPAIEQVQVIASPL